MNHSTTTEPAPKTKRKTRSIKIDVDECEQHEFVEDLGKAAWPHLTAMGIAVVGPFIGLLIAIVILWQIQWVGWVYIAMMLVGWAATSMGITIGFHRLLTHKSFDTFGWVKAIWTIMGSLSVEGPPLTWCAVHRLHHAKSDQQGDPHSPNLNGKGFWNWIKGFAFSQVGWLFTGVWSKIDLNRYVPDLVHNRWLQAVDKNYYMFVLISLAIPTAIGGLIDGYWGMLMGFLWGGLARIFMTHHITWSINSVCHLFGAREYKSTDDSRNNVVCGILAFGEGWHNNHHAFPSSARHGLRWWQFDASWIVIRMMQCVGLAWNVKTPSSHALASRKIG